MCGFAPLRGVVLASSPGGGSLSRNIRVVRVPVGLHFHSNWAAFPGLRATLCGRRVAERAKNNGSELRSLPA